MHNGWEKSLRSKLESLRVKGKDMLPLGTGPRGVAAATDDCRTGELISMLPLVTGPPAGEDR